MPSFESQGYRDKLAAELKQAPKSERREILDKAILSDEYWDAKSTRIDKKYYAEHINPHSEKLAEYLTGFKLDDPRLVDKLIEDKERIRGKYNLPSDVLVKASPYEFEMELKALAKKHKVDIQKKSEFADFFEKHPYANGVNVTEERRVGLDIDRESETGYKESLDTLAHELIHAMQAIESPRMPIEVMEYEAYVGANLHNLEKMKDDTERKHALDFIFGFMIARSVEHWYQEQSRIRNEEVRPSWE